MTFSNPNVWQEADKLTRMNNKFLTKVIKRNTQGETVTNDLEGIQSHCLGMKRWNQESQNLLGELAKDLKTIKGCYRHVYSKWNHEIRQGMKLLKGMRKIQLWFKEGGKKAQAVALNILRRFLSEQIKYNLRQESIAVWQRGKGGVSGYLGPL